MSYPPLSTLDPDDPRAIARRESLRRSHEKAKAQPGWRKRQQEIQNRHIANLRAKVIAGYGGACSCCGNDRAVQLEIDHVDGNGQEDRARSYYTFLRRLIREGFPDDCQILCGSCHLEKTREGRCSCSC